VKKVKSEKAGWILPTGFFTFSHLNFFTFKNLSKNPRRWCFHHRKHISAKT